MGRHEGLLQWTDGSVGTQEKEPVQLNSTDGMETFSNSKRVVARWSEHFQKLLNVPGDRDHEALDNIPQRIIKTSLDEIPTTDEMARAIAGLKMAMHLEEMEFPQKYGSTEETICSAD